MSSISLREAHRFCLLISNMIICDSFGARATTLLGQSGQLISLYLRINILAKNSEYEGPWVLDAFKIWALERRANSISAIRTIEKKLHGCRPRKLVVTQLHNDK